MTKDVKQLVAQLRRMGYPVGQRRRSNHVVVETPAGKVFLPATPSDVRSPRNCIAQLRRAGVAL